MSDHSVVEVKSSKSDVVAGAGSGVGAGSSSLRSKLTSAPATKDNIGSPKSRIEEAIEAAPMTPSNRLTEAQKLRIRAAFDTFDNDSTGFITAKDLRPVCCC